MFSLFKVQRIGSKGFQTLAGLNSVRTRATLGFKPAKDYRQSLLSVPATKVTTLDNGFRVATENTNIETACVGVWVDAGSRFEDARTNGTAHFLEHMAFKGTSKRTQHDLELEIENMGGHLNAYTSREQTVYYANVFKNDIPKAVDILQDILHNSKYDQHNIESERHVILREAEEVAKMDQEVVFDHLHAIAFQGNSLGRTILGPTENIQSITRDDLIRYVTKNYTAPRMVLSAAGGVDHDQLVDLASKHFGSLPKVTEKIYEPAAFVGSEVRDRDDFLGKAYLALGFEGCSWTSPDYFPLLVATSCLGTWDRSMGAGTAVASRLAQRFAKESFADSFFAFHTNYHDTGLFGVYAVGNDKLRVDDVIYSIQQELVRLCLDITESEVDRAKQQLKAGLLLQMDGTVNLCEEIGRQMLIYGRRIPPYEINKRLDEINADTVRAVCSKYLYDKDPAVVGRGAVEGLPDYNRIQTATSWLRY